MDMNEFKLIANDAWKQMMETRMAGGEQAELMDQIFRIRRQYGDEEAGSESGGGSESGKAEGSTGKPEGRGNSNAEDKSKGFLSVRKRGNIICQ